MVGVGQLVDPARDRISVDGRPIGGAQKRLYLVMAKPAGVTSTVSDRHAERTVLDLRDQGRLKLEPLISHVVSACNVADAFRLLDERPHEAVQVVLDFS